MVTSSDILVITCHEIDGYPTALRIAKPPWGFGSSWDICLTREPNELAMDFEFRALSELGKHKYTHIFGEPSPYLGVYDFDPH